MYAFCPQTLVLFCQSALPAYLRGIVSDTPPPPHQPADVGQEADRPSTPHPSSTDVSADVYQSLRLRLRAWLEEKSSRLKYAELILLAPDLLHLMTRLVADRRVSAVQRAKLLATIAYFVTPIGIVPEALVGPIGYVDDVALAAYVLNGMLNSDQAHLVREHWAGDKDVLNVVQGVLELADSAISSGLWRRFSGFRFPKFRK